MEPTEGDTLQTGDKVIRAHLRGESIRLIPPVVLLLSAYVAARVATLLTIVVAHQRRPDLQWSQLFAPGDSGYYTGIARNGYPETVPTAPHAGDASIAFFPGYPLLIRAVAEAIHAPLIVTGIVVNVLIGAAVVLVGYVLAQQYLDKRAAFRATLLFIGLPGSVVFSFPYADGLLILLCMMSLLFLAREDWLLAGLVGALATATRANSIGLVLAALVASLISIHRHRRWISLAAPALMPLGMLGYFSFLWRHTGNALAWFQVQRDVWGQELDLGRGFLGPLKHEELWRSWAWWLSESGLFLLAIAVWSAYKLWRSDKTWRPFVVPLSYTGVVVAQMFAYSSVGFRPRFMLVAFPLVWVIARQWPPPYLYGLAAALALMAPPLAYVFVTDVTVL